MSESLRESMIPVLIEVGSIVQISQQFEFGLKYAISLLKELEGDNLADDVFSAEFDALSKRTLGPLIRKFSKHAQISSTFGGVLERALTSRNNVIHNYFTDNIDFLATRKGREQSVLQLQKLWKDVAAGVIAVDQVVPELMRASGIDPEETSRVAWDAIER